MITLFPDIPRIYTALAESIACILVCFPLVLEKEWKKNSCQITLILVGQIVLQLLAGKLPLIFWALGMFVNVCWMFLSIYLLGFKRIKSCLYITAKAFISAELVASIAWHIYCLTIYQSHYDSLVSQWILMASIYVLVFLVLYSQEKKVSMNKLEKIIESRDVLVGIFTSLSIFIISNIGFILSDTLQFHDSTNIFILRTMMNFSGILLLLTQESHQYDRYLQDELSSIHGMFQMQYKQYQAYRENSDLISRKVHDFKHQLYLIRQEADKKKQNQYLDEMTLAMQNFEAKIETGNPVLDTILTQKNHYCLQNDINFTCIVQGELLHFMDVMDISALFGNAMDNAIEAVQKIDNTEQRLITLKVSSHSQFVVIRLDNYDKSNLDLSKNAFPETSKEDKDYHGIGLKSMEYIAHKYKGNLTLTKEDNWVRLKILLPQNKKAGL